MSLASAFDFDYNDKNAENAEMFDLSERHLAWFMYNALPENNKKFPSQAGEGNYPVQDTSGVEKSGTTECVFFEDEPSVPYINPVDYLKNIYTVDFEEVKNSDGTYTVTKATGEKMTLDANADTVAFDLYENYFADNPEQSGSSMQADFVLGHPYRFEGEPQGVTFALSKYQIDVAEVDGDVYLPLPTIADIFDGSYNAAMYLDGRIYYTHTYGAENYVDRSSHFSTVERHKSRVGYEYREFCFVMDNLYGRPYKSKMSPSIEELGLDKTLETYNDDTRMIKTMLLSDSKIDYMVGMSLLQEYFYDGGHTALHAELSDYNTDTVLGRAWKDFMDNPDNAALNKRIIGLDFREDVLTYEFMLKPQREEKYAQYEKVNSWESGTVYCVREGDTLVFVFDKYVQEVVHPFKWSLDYAKENGIKTFIVDDSANTGGSSSVLAYILQIMLNSQRHSNVFEMKMSNTATQNVYVSPLELDLNLDGKIDDADKEVVYDFNFAILASGRSFSCGNLLPVLAQENGIPILGETSGGGECALDVRYTPATVTYGISSSTKLMAEKGAIVDKGAAPDYSLVEMVYNADVGKKIKRFSNMYDIPRITKMIDDFYNNPAVWGDVDGDGAITIADATAVQKYAIDLPTDTPCFIAHVADVNGDGRVSVLDVTCIQKYVAEFTTGTGRTGQPAA